MNAAYVASVDRQAVDLMKTNMGVIRKRLGEIRATYPKLSTDIAQAITRLNEERWPDVSPKDLKDVALAEVRSLQRHTPERREEILNQLRLRDPIIHSCVKYTIKQLEKEAKEKEQANASS